MNHANKIARVAGELLRNRGRRPVSFKKATVSHQVPTARHGRPAAGRIDVSDLNQILEIDVDAMTCTAEPGVTFVDLVAATLPLGVVPMIVPELKTITIGGAVSGCSLESMSFRYGGFHDTCLEYEVITANGEVLTCTAENEHQLVFQMMHGSFGTLGLLSKLKFRLVAARPYVHVTYHEHPDLPGYSASIARHFAAQDVDFMDGIIHARDKYVLSLGRFVDEAPYAHRYDWTKVYYKSTGERREDYLATADYFFRYDHGVTNVHPKTAIGRLLVGKLMSSDRLLRVAKKLDRVLCMTQPDVTVDLFIPFSKVDEFMQWYEHEIGFFPIWCVPYRLGRPYEWIANDYLSGITDELFLDLAIYGLKQRGNRNYYRDLERKLLEVQGIKTLISHNYYDEDVFWGVWNKPNYLAVKQITDPENAFSDLYVKTCGAAR